MWRALASTILCLAALGSKVVAQTYEAEAGVLTGVTVDTAASGYSGTGYVTGFDAADDQVAIAITTPTYGVYSLSVRYRAANGDKKAALFLDGTGAGEVSLTSSTSFTSVTAGKLLLTQGAHTLTIKSDWGWYDIDSITLAPAPLPPATGTFEAEDGILTGNTYIDSTSATGFSGTGFVTGFQAPGDSVAILVNAPSYAVYTLTVRYRAPYGYKKTAMSINGSPSGEVELPEINEFTTVPAGKVLLNQGSNIISFENDWGWYNIDAITIALAPTPPPHKANKAPVDKLATWEARSLLKYIQNKYGKKILSGQQELEYIDWLKTNVGKKPAIAGLDLIDYSPSRAEHNLTSHAIEDAFAWDKLGGITTFVWHWNAPSGLLDIPGQEWWRGTHPPEFVLSRNSLIESPLYRPRLLHFSNDVRHRRNSGQQKWRRLQTHPARLGRHRGTAQASPKQAHPDPLEAPARVRRCGLVLVVGQGPRGDHRTLQAHVQAFHRTSPPP